MQNYRSLIARFFMLSAWLFFISCATKKNLNITHQFKNYNNYLEQNFASPPDSVKPYCYYYWISGNISEEGITKDLEAMARVGIGEAFIGNVGMGEPYGQIKVLSPEWWRLTEHAIREGKRLGVNIGIFNSPGWSQSGGPWVKPSQAMRYLVFSEKRIKGGRRIDEQLTMPKDTFQDVSVIAFPAPKDDTVSIADFHPEIQTVPSIPYARLLIDHNTDVDCFFPKGKDFTVNLETHDFFTARALILFPSKTPFMAEGELQAEQNGIYTTVKKFRYDRSNPNVNVGPMAYGPISLAFSEVTAKKYRLIFTNIRGGEPVPGMADIPYKAGLSEIYLSASPKIERYVEKQLGKMFQTPLPYWKEYQWPSQPIVKDDLMEIQKDKVIDISKYMQANGRLTWDAPVGNWVVMRIGVTPTGTKNSPASPEATGFEVDKMSRQYLENHYNSYIGKILKDMPAEDRTAFKHVVADSYEMGSENYTEGFAADFKKRYGYDYMNWLPTLSGRVVGSTDQSDRFFWDVRRLIADKVAYDYVGGLRDISHKDGLRIWLENYGHWGFPSEFLMYGGQSNEIAGEFWTEGTLGNVECRAASSAAHIYGVNKVFAESFTGVGGAFEYYPARLKKRGDWSFTEGINQVLLHVYIHQPYEDRSPGMNAWFGTEFNRKNTWFDQSKTWIDYERRNMFMLQQGKPVNDVCYFIGEDAPKMTGVQDPALPKGYSFDYINAEVILQRMSVKDGRLVLPDGMSYRLLVLPKLGTMRPELLKKIRQLVFSGATVLGPEPVRSPSMENFPFADQEVQKIARDLWGEVNGTTIKFRKYGKGMIMNGTTMQEALNMMNTPPDLELPETAPVLFTHRQIPGGDVYFISNQSDNKININPVFRIADKAPELWDATTGKLRKLPQYIIKDKRIAVPLELDSVQSYFLVFRSSLKPANGINFPKAVALQIISTPWQVQFDVNKGGPKTAITLNSLTDWAKNSDDRIRYFSGTAIYHNTFNFKTISKDKRVLLKFDDIKDIAKISVNGKYVGSLWTYPLQLDITDAMVPGKNNIEIEVTNLWVNRLVGDSRLPLDKRKTWLANNPIKPGDPLKPSGLIGKVILMEIKY